MQAEELFLANLALIDRIIGFIARRNRMEKSEAEEFASTARLKLIENDYAVLRSFEGKAQLSTYLTVVLQRLALDLRVHEWGKWRSSAEARRLGDDAVLLEQLTHRDGLTFAEAAQRLRELRPHLSAQQVETLRAALPQRSRRARADDDAETLLARIPSGESADALAMAHEREESARNATTAFDAAISSLDDEEQLILRLRFGNGMKVPALATMLGVDQKKLYKRIDKLLATLRENLRERGVSPDEVRELVTEGADGMELAIFRGAAEFERARPSLMKAELRTGADSE